MDREERFGEKVYTTEREREREIRRPRFEYLTSVLIVQPTGSRLKHIYSSK